MAKDLATIEVWTTAFEKEWVNLAQGYYKKGTKGTDSMCVLDHKEINISLQTALLQMPTSWYTNAHKKDIPTASE